MWTVLHGAVLHRFPSCLPFRVFLDKVCIHQTDALAEGIENLDAYAVKSDTFVVFRANDYFKRLWKLYEFGTVLLS